MLEHHMNYQGSDFKILFNAYEGSSGTYWEPPEPGYIEISHIFNDEEIQVDVTNAFTDAAFEELHELVEEQYDWEAYYCFDDDYAMELMRDEQARQGLYSDNEPEEQNESKDTIFD